MKYYFARCFLPRCFKLQRCILQREPWCRSPEPTLLRLTTSQLPNVYIERDWITFWGFWYRVTMGNSTERVINRQTQCMISPVFSSEIRCSLSLIEVWTLSKLYRIMYTERVIKVQRGQFHRYFRRYWNLGVQAAAIGVGEETTQYVQDC